MPEVMDMNTRDGDFDIVMCHCLVGDVQLCPVTTYPRYLPAAASVIVLEFRGCRIRVDIEVVLQVAKEHKPSDCLGVL